MVANLIFNAGLRIGELTRLRKSDFEPNEKDEECIWVNIREEIAKGGWSRRVSMNLNLKLGNGRTVGSIISEYLETLPPKQPPDAPLFPKRGDLSANLSTATLSRDFSVACRRAGVASDLCHAHSGRHTFAISQLKGGADIETVSRNMGHHGLSATWIYLQQAESDHVGITKQSLKNAYAHFD